MNAWLESPSGCSYSIEGVCSIGRSSQNTIALTNPSVSRRHALIHSQGQGEFWLVDLGSSNGVLVNGRRISQPIRLSEDDEIQVGEARFRFRRGTAQHLAAATADTAVTLRESLAVSTWMLIADIKGSTSLSNSISNDRLAQLVGGWFLRCKEAVERRHGSINKYLGDGFLAWWPDAKNADLSVATLLEELVEMQAHDPVAFRWVAHFGEVRVERGLFAGEDSLIGAEVNFAFRMEKLAGSLGASTLLSQTAMKRLPSSAGLKPAGAHSLAGFDNTHDFFHWP